MGVNMVWGRRKFHDFPREATEKADAGELTTEQVIELYKGGFAGAKYDPEKMDEFKAAMLQPDGEQIAHAMGMADTGAGKLVIPFVHVLEMFPGCWPGRIGQGRGDCVSWGTRNSSLGTMVADIVSGQPDEKTGKPEEKPDVSPEGIADGVLSTETFYWHRGHGGEGWFCPEAARVACQKSGLMIRKNYPELGVDLTKYSSSTAGKYGRTPPPASVIDVTDNNLIHQATQASGLEVRRDLLFNGYFVLDCGGEGYSNTRDENGVSKRSGSWAHSMTEIGVDDRDAIKQIYNEPLVLILNSWAKWNRGPRDIFQSAALVPADKKQKWVECGIVNPTTGNIMIPEGSFWAPWSHVKRREAIAMSGANGWPRKKLPDLDWSF
jgi:hypothetical protein